MNHLIIYAHINNKSFCRAILDVIVETSKAKGADVNVRDLNTMNFQPVLTATDMVELQQGIIPDDIQVEQNLIKMADVISFVYPLWWAHMPAVMKGYIDRIFSYGFAYTYTNNASQGLLSDKKIVLITPMGNPYDEYKSMGMIDALEMTTDTGIFRFCGITDIEHIHFGSVTAVSGDERKQMLEKVELLVRSKL